MVSGTRDLQLLSWPSVGNGLDSSMDWIGLDQDFQETLWFGLDSVA